jgi:hypothetical protein
MTYYACCTKYRNIKPCQTQKSVCLWMAFNLDYVIWDLAVCIVTLLLYILYGITGHVFIPCTRVICHQHYLVIFMVMMFNATIFQLYHGGAVVFVKKTTNLSQATDKLYHIMLYRAHLAKSGIWIHIFSGDMHLLYR